MREKIDVDEKEKELATVLHSECQGPHEDRCGWFYDTGDWTQSSRQHYLEKARSMIANLSGKKLSIDQIIKVAKAVRK